MAKRRSLVLLSDATFSDLGLDLDTSSDVFESLNNGGRAERESLLGSRIEEELNKSIEKMRETEKSGDCDEIAVGDPGHSMDSHRTPHGRNQRGSSKDELLEDIEMPSLSISTTTSPLDCFDRLVSISPDSPLKQPSVFLDGSSTSSFRDFGKVNETRQLRLFGATLENKKDIGDVDKIVGFCSSAPMKVTSLISVNSNSDESAKSEDWMKENSIYKMAPSRDKSANMTSSPVSPSSHPAAMSFSLLDMDNLDDNLLTALQVADSPSVKPSEEHNDSEDFDAVDREVQKLCMGLGKKSDVSLRMGAFAKNMSLLPPSNRLTLGGIPLLDMEELDDSLLTKSRMVDIDEDFAFPSPVKEYKKNIMSKEGIKQQVIEDGLSARVSSKIVENLNETHNICNRSRSLNDLQKLLNPVTSMKKTFGSLEQMLDNVDGTFVMKDVAPTLDSDSKSKTVKPILLGDNIKVVIDGKEAENPHGVNTTFDQFEKMVANLTFCNKKNAPVNVTFEDIAKSASCNLDVKTLDANVTFDTNAKSAGNALGGIVKGASCRPNLDIRALGANDTFNTQAKSTGITFNGKVQDINSTFDFKTQPAITTEHSTNLEVDCQENNKNGKEKLNVTFEGGEYHIGNLNETVNLMDAEGEVLKLILDSTPQKPSRVPPGAVSTPLGCNNTSSAAKRTVTKDPSQTFLHRLSLGMRKNSQDDSKEKHQGTGAEQPPNLHTAMPGIKLGYGGQIRKFQSNQPGKQVKNGPIRALPLQAMSLGSTDGSLPKETDFQDNNTPEGVETGKLAQGTGGRARLPSFGSFSSIENDRPSTPDLFISSGVFTSTPDVFRPGSVKSRNPRVTSTPAARLGGPFDNGAMDGPTATPILAPSSRVRFGTMSSTASLPEESSLDDPERKADFKNVNKGNTGISAKKSLDHCMESLKSNIDKNITQPIASIDQKVEVVSKEIENVDTKGLHDDGGIPEESKRNNDDKLVSHVPSDIGKLKETLDCITTPSKILQDLGVVGVLPAEADPVEDHIVPSVEDECCEIVSELLQKDAGVETSSRDKENPAQEISQDGGCISVVPKQLSPCNTNVTSSALVAEEIENVTPQVETLDSHLVEKGNPDIELPICPEQCPDENYIGSTKECKSVRNQSAKLCETGLKAPEAENKNETIHVVETSVPALHISEVAKNNVSVSKSVQLPTEKVTLCSESETQEDTKISSHNVLAVSKELSIQGEASLKRPEAENINETIHVVETSVPALHISEVAKNNVSVSKSMELPTEKVTLGSEVDTQEGTKISSPNALAAISNVLSIQGDPICVYHPNMEEVKECISVSQKSPLIKKTNRTVIKVNSPLQKIDSKKMEGKALATPKKKGEADKENVKTQDTRKANSQQYTATNNKGMLKHRLPANRISLAPPKIKIEKENTKSAPVPKKENTKSAPVPKNKILKVNNAFQKPQRTEVPKIGERTRNRTTSMDKVTSQLKEANAKESKTLINSNGYQRPQRALTPTSRAKVQSPSLVKKEVKVNSIKPSGLKVPNTKMHLPAPSNSENGTTSRLQQPGRSAVQSQASSKLPLVRSSRTGIPMKGVVRSQSGIVPPLIKRKL